MRSISAALLQLVLGLGLSVAASQGVKAEPFVSGLDQFDFTYAVKMPKLQAGQKAEVWIPLASTDPYQKVERQISAPGLTVQTGRDLDFHNEVLHVSALPADSAKELTVTYHVTRLEQGPYPADASEKLDLYLRSERLVPLSDRFKKLAREITAGRSTVRAKARAIYDYVFKEMKYDKTGDGWGRGDAVYACDAKTGNCTDFHALFVALARSVGIPANFAIGFTIPAEGKAGTIAGYHCWAEFLADGQWVPIDISEANKAPQFKDYYFGHHPANRLQLSQGRDLRLVPAAAAGPVNYLVSPYIEVNGKPLKGTVATYTFSRKQQPEVRS